MLPIYLIYQEIQNFNIDYHIRLQDMRFQNNLQKMFWNANEIWEKHLNWIISPALFIFPGSCCNLYLLCNSWIYSFKKEILCERLDMWIRVDINMGLLTTTFYRMSKKRTIHVNAQEVWTILTLTHYPAHNLIRRIWKKV